MHSSIALKIVREGMTAYNGYIPKANEEDSYFIEGMAENVKQLKYATKEELKEKKQTNLFLEAICDGKMLQRANKEIGYKICTEADESIVDTIIDDMERLVSKYPSDEILYKADYALL